MTNYAITGVAGFIGSHLAESLIEQGHHVIGIDNFDPFYAKSIKERNLQNLNGNPEFQLFSIDVRTEDFVLALSNTHVDTVIHLSARAGVRPSLLFPQSYIQHDIEATVNVLETCRRLNIDKMVFGSSSSVYGNIPDLPYSENIKINEPISPYAAAKLSCELFNYVYHSQYGLNITNLRFFTVYGPRQRPEMGIHKFTRLIDQGKTVQMYGDGTTSRDYTYIDDIIQGVVKACEVVSGYNTYNLGNNNPVTLKDLILIISKTLGVDAKIEQLSMQPGDVNHTLADISLAEKELNYKPQTSIVDGVEKFVNWYSKINNNRK
ncbi:MAG: NAD-dependent epimerase/dehydratase family protein [Candidatus Heimdallarchaeota archaeon]|nr:NAD-dependent epimerase/dehydratase family protein [Candidatus Heimdallarchaeota archaeon]